MFEMFENQAFRRDLLKLIYKEKEEIFECKY